MVGQPKKSMIYLQELRDMTRSIHGNHFLYTFANSQIPGQNSPFTGDISCISSQKRKASQRRDEEPQLPSQDRLSEKRKRGKKVCVRFLLCAVFHVFVFPGKQ